MCGKETKKNKFVEKSHTTIICINQKQKSISVIFTAIQFDFHFVQLPVYLY